MSHRKLRAGAVDGREATAWLDWAWAEAGWRAWLVRWGALAAVYFGAAKGGLALAYAHGQVTAVWPPSGIALAAVYFWGYRAWPGVMLGAFLANLSTGAPVLVDVGIALGNTGEALAGAWLLRRAGFRLSLVRIRDIGAILLAAGASTLISATVGTLSLWLGDLIQPRELASVWRVWWLGDTGGDLLLAPLLMLIAARAFSMRITRWRLVEAGCVAVALLSAGLLVLSRADFVYLVFPALIWAALRFGQLGATLSSVTIASLAVWFTAHGTGPFAGGSPDDSLLASQSFMGVVQLTVLCLAAVTATRDRAERAVREGEARKSAMLDATLDSVITADHAGRIVEFNRAAERTFGYALADVRGKELSELIIPERLREEHRRALARYVNTGRSHLAERRMETVALRADGSEFPVELTVTRIELEGSPVFTAFVRDITEPKSAERRLIFLAEHDPLTGLINRRRFDSELARQIELAARYGQPGSLIVMDVDNLKQVNDAFGHAVGDELLRKLAETLRRHLRSSDIVARLGGDEFVALLPSVDDHQALAAAEHLLSSVRSTVLRHDGHDVRATLSVGVCAIRGERTSEQLLIDADRAMYHAKQLGRDRVIRHGALELEPAEG